MSHRARPNVQTVPPGAQNPTIPGSPVESWSPYLQSQPPNNYQFRPYAGTDTSGLYVPERMHTRSTSAHAAPPPVAFPEPQLSRSSSYASSLIRAHRPSKSDSSFSQDSLFRRESLDYSTESELVETPDSLSEELSNLTLESDEGLRRFQNNMLPASEEEWHKLVPPEAREALGKHEVERQSVLFELFKAEKDYVNDLRLVREVFMHPLKNQRHEPAIMREDRLRGFIQEVFYNIDAITAHHQRMLNALFERQREQHPLVHSIADIVLDTVLLFRDEYESYIKHYPLAEARHRAELKRNRDYHYFMQQAVQDPRVRKHDLATFLSRPVTRLPRLSLVLEHLHKLTDSDHPDQETLPLILSILSEFIKSTQPGIAAADSKAKFWDLSESLQYMKGEIIDMDLYDEKRTLVHSGVLARRQRSETDWHGWNDYFIALLDNYLLLTREEDRGAGVIKRHVTSRPIPLEYLQLGSFNDSPEVRKERPEGGRLLSFRSEHKPMYPLTVYHTSSKSSRRYTLYASSESIRERWHEALRDAIVVRRVSQEANMIFAPSTINDGYFRVASMRVQPEAGVRFTGRPICATSFSVNHRKYLVVGCMFGIFVCQKGTNAYVRAFSTSNPLSMVGLSEFNKLLVLHDNSLYNCPLDSLARITDQGISSQHDVPTLRRVSSTDDHVLFFRTGKVGSRTLVMYGVKSILQVYIHALEIVNVEGRATAQRERVERPSFRAFGDPVGVPKDVHDITPLVRTIAICGEKGIYVADPTNLSKSVMIMVPDFRQATNNLPMADLKSRCENARPLGMARCDSEELLVIYDDLGCFVTKHGIPSRKCGYVRWETKAESFVHRGRYILLFSPEFIEVRNVNSGRLVQVLEGEEIRLLSPIREKTDDVLVSMQGSRDDSRGVSHKFLELLETAEIQTPSSSGHELWAEWDMA